MACVGINCAPQYTTRYVSYAESKLPVLFTAPVNTKAAEFSWGNKDHLGGVVVDAQGATMQGGTPRDLEQEPMSLGALRLLQGRNGFSRCAAQLFPCDWEAVSMDAAMPQILAQIALLAPGSSVRLQAYPKALSVRLIDELFRQGVEMRPVGFSVLLVAFQPMEAMPFRFGVHAAAVWENQLQCGEQERLAVRTKDAEGDNHFNRARLKMTEALELVADHPRQSLALAGRALDIGASPGGWSYTLASLDAVTECLAVDPAELNPAVVNHCKVIHIPQMMQDALPRLLSTHAGSIAICSCDANREAEDLAAVISTCAPLLQQGAPLILTFKLQKRCGPQLLAKIDLACKDLLAADFEGMELHWLFANSTNERTLLAWRNGSEAGTAALKKS